MMYSEFIGFIDVPMENWMPGCLSDPDITILDKKIVGPKIEKITPDAALMRIYISDEDAAYLKLKYPAGQSNIFTKVDK
jgi:hypothetical protein